MKIFVIVYGLLGLVPVTKSPGDIMALLVDTYHMQMHAGTSAMPHYPEIGLYKADAQNSTLDQIIELAGDDFEILDISAGDLDIPEPMGNGKERILRFKDVLGVIGDNPYVASGCIGDQPATDCVSGGHPLLSGRLKMKGHVLVRPLELVLNRPAFRLVERNQLTNLDTATQWGFRTVDTGQRVGAANPYSSAILLVVDVPAAKLPAKVRLARGDDFKLSPAGKNTCGNLWTAAGLPKPVAQCAMVMVTNAPFPQDKASDVTVDHTELLYPLFKDGSAHKLRAYRQRRVVINSGPGNGPGNHCVGGLIEPKP